MCGAEARLPHPVGLAPQLKQGLRGGPAPQRPAEKRGKRWARVAVTAVPGTEFRPEQDGQCLSAGAAAQGPADRQSRQLSSRPMLRSGAGAEG